MTQVDTLLFLTAAECEAILNEAIEDSAQLAWLQHWLRQLE